MSFLILLCDVRSFDTCQVIHPLARNKMTTTLLNIALIIIYKSHPSTSPLKLKDAYLAHLFALCVVMSVCTLYYDHDLGLVFEVDR